MRTTYFNKEFEVSQGVESVRTDLLRYFTPRVARWGYAPREQGGTSFRYAKRFTPTWAIVCAILLFPIGLLALLARRDSELVVNLIERSAERTQLVVVGAIPPARIRSLDNYPPTAPPPEGEQPRPDVKPDAGSSAEAESAS